MPGNEFEDEIHNLFKLDNSFQGQHLPQAGDENWPVLNYDQWVEKLRQIVAPQNFNLESYNVQQLDSVKRCGDEALSVPYDQNYTQLSPTLEYSQILSRDHQLNTNGFLLGYQGFGMQLNQLGFLGENTGYDQYNLISRGFSIFKSHQENDSCESPTLTTNSERSEITEASTDFNFLKGQQQLLNTPYLGIQQPLPMQQSGYNDMRLLQQHIMIKQLQDLQRQQQLQQFGDVRQQNTLNQLSAIAKQSATGQFSPLINGTPVHEASQVFMSSEQRGTSLTSPGASNRVVFPQDQGQAFRLMGLSSQQPDASLYGAPVSSARCNMSQYSQQGISNDTVNLFTKAGGQAQYPTVQSSGSFLRDQYTVSPDQVYKSQGALISNPGFPGKDTFGPASVQSINGGSMSGSFQAGNAAQVNAFAKDFNGRQEQAGWPAMQQKTTLIGPSQGLVPLDPIEEKLLYNMDDNLWDASLGRHTDLGSGSFSNVLENSDFSNSFPSIQSGSWSALMQSAVAEASSSDTGLQEEWSGLTFQNTEQSTGNQLPNLVDNDKQQAGWVDGNLQSASSFGSKPLPMFNDSGVSSKFPGFKQPATQFSTEQGENLPHGVSHRLSPKVTSEWVDCATQQKQSFEGGQQAQSYMHLDNSWAGQTYEHSESGSHPRRATSPEDFGLPYTKHNGSTNDGFLPKTSNRGVEQAQSGSDNSLFSRKDSQINNNQSTGQGVIDKIRSDYTRHANMSAAKESESTGKKQHQLSNGPHGFANSLDGEGEIYVSQQRSYQRQASNDSYNSKGLSGRDQGHSGQVKFLGDVSSGSANFNEVCSPLEEVTSGVDIKSVGPGGSKTAARTSQNMLELLHKINLPKEAAMAYSGSIDSNALAKVPEAEAHTSVAQVYNPSSASEGFGLRLALPSQRLPNSNLFLNSKGSPQTLSYLKSGQVNQTSAAPPYSIQSLPSAHEFSQRVHLDGISSTSGQTGVLSYSNMQGSTVAAFASSLPHLKNQTQMQHMLHSPLASESLQVTLANASRNPPFNLAISQDASRQISASHFGQQFPVLEASQVSQPSIISGMSRQGEFSAVQGAWTTLPTQQNLSVSEPLKVPASLHPSMDSTDCIMNSNTGGYGEMQAGKERFLPQISSDMTDSSQPASFSQGEPSQKHCLNTSALPSSSLSHSNQKVLDGITHDNNQASTTSERNFAPVAHSLKSSNGLQQNYSMLHQIQAINTAETDLSKSNDDSQQVASVVGQQLHVHNSRSKNSMDSGPSLAAAGDNEIISFFTRSSEDPTVQALSQTALQSMPSHEMVRIGQNNSQSQSTSSSYVTNHLNHGQRNLHMAPSWFKEYGSFRNGQMLSLSDARNIKSVSGQFSFLKPTQNLHIHASVGQLDAGEASQAAISRPSLATTLVENEHFSASFVLPSSINNQNIVITRPKKRKAMTSELLPWCKEVSQGSQKPQNISVSEQEWADATNRLCEKVEDEVEILEDVHPMLRSKRRLVLTTQLMQILLHPPPASILGADATSDYDSISYFVSRVALGDACSLSCGVRNNMQLSSDTGDMISEKPKTFEKTGDHKIFKVMEGLTDRAKKLENNFQRLDKKVSVLDIRLECQELERFSVINRFARFHIRGPGDISEAASSAAIHKPVPQRYVTALPMPRNLPEGLQCFSL